MCWIGLEKIIPNCADFQHENTENLMLYLWLSALICVPFFIFCMREIAVAAH